MGKTADRFRAILKSVAADLRVEPTSDLCKHVATLRLARENMQVRLLAGETRLQAKINEEESQAHVNEFFKVAAELDKEGESPDRLARWKNLHCQLRTARRLGQSFAMCDSVTERLRSLPGTKPLPAELRTWAAVAKNWVR